MKVRSDWFQILLLAFFNAFYYWLEDQCINQTENTTKNKTSLVEDSF